MRLLISLITLSILSACAISNKAPLIELQTLSGSVTGQPYKDWPLDTELHLFLKGITGERSEGSIISSQHILLNKGVQAIPFAIKYKPSDIQENAEYAVQACITISGDVALVSEEDVPVLTHEHNKNPVIRMAAIQTDTGISGLFVDAETALRRAIQTNLIDICRKKTADYDHFTSTRASLILPSNLLAGPHHKVREQVDLLGPHYFFIVNSDYGEFTAQGMSLLKKLIHEFNAIAELRKITRSEAYLKATAESALVPFVEVKELLWHPVDTIAGIPKGMVKFINVLPTSFTMGRSEYEDRYLAALITVSKYKRRYAEKLGIDVYSNNLMLQYELDRLCWAEALGNWTPSIMLLPFYGPGKTAYSALGLTETLNSILVEKAPDLLRHENDVSLTKMGVSEELRKRFLNHKNYSPRMFTIITRSLEKMEDVKGKDKFIQEAVQAKTVVDAFTFQQIMELLLDYHLNVNPITEIVLYQGIPVGYSANQDIVITFPADIFRWTPFSKNIAVDIDNRLSSKLDIRNKTFRISGKLTDRTRHNLNKLGVGYSEQVEIFSY